MAKHDLILFLEKKEQKNCNKLVFGFWNSKTQRAITFDEKKMNVKENKASKVFITRVNLI